MTRSIFDPTGGETEHSGGPFTGAAADNDAHMPTRLTEADNLTADTADADVVDSNPFLEADAADARDRAIGQLDLDVSTSENQNPPGTANDAPAIPARRGNENEN